MKKLVFGLIATVMFSTLSFAQSKIAYSDYGFYHNESLDLLNNNRSEWSKMNINQTLDYLSNLLSKKYPDKFSNVDLTKAKKIFEGHTLNTFGYNELAVMWNSNKENFYANENLPERTGAIIDKLITNNLNSEQVLTEISINKSSKNSTENEINSLVVMESVLKSSTAYWNNNSVITAGKKDCWIADMVVSLIFIESGPLSIIGGAMASQICENTNKH